MYVLKNKFVFRVCFLNMACVSEKNNCVLKNECVCICVCVRVKNVCTYQKVRVSVFACACVSKKK